MVTVKIPRKMSGVECIADLASNNFDRLIEFAENQNFAVVQSGYYYNFDIDDCQKFETLDDAVQAALADEHCGLIVGADGTEYDKRGEPLGIAVYPVVA